MRITLWIRLFWSIFQCRFCPEIFRGINPHVKVLHLFRIWLTGTFLQFVVTKAIPIYRGTRKPYCRWSSVKIKWPCLVPQHNRHRRSAFPYPVTAWRHLASLTRHLCLLTWPVTWMLLLQWRTQCSSGNSVRQVYEHTDVFGRRR
jgi:hypothetical protein